MALARCLRRPTRRNPCQRPLGLWFRVYFFQSIRMHLIFGNKTYCTVVVIQHLVLTCLLTSCLSVILRSGELSLTLESPSIQLSQWKNQGSASPIPVYTDQGPIQGTVAFAPQPGPLIGRLNVHVNILPICIASSVKGN